MEGINVLSLFDGLSCGQLALEDANIKVANYFASEIEKPAIKVSSYNYPNMTHLGDVRNVDVSKLPRINLLLGGSPCTDLSVAGKQRGMSTSTSEDVKTLDQYLRLKESGYEFQGQSFLFWEYVRILHELRKANPDVLFLLENTNMPMKWKKVITDALGIPPIVVNSRLVSAQNRERLYWCNFKTETYGLFGEPYCAIPQPKDKGVFLRDILEKGPVAEKYYIKNPKFGFNGMGPDEKGRTLRVGGKSSQTDKHNHDLVKVVEGFIKIDKKGNPKADQVKASCFTAGAHSGGNHSDMDLIKEVIQLNPSLESGGKQPYQQNRVYGTNGLSPALCADKADLLIEEPAILTPKRTEYGKQIRKDYEKGLVQEQRKNIQSLERREDGKSNCLTTVTKDNLLQFPVCLTEVRTEEAKRTRRITGTNSHRDKAVTERTDGKVGTLMTNLTKDNLIAESCSSIRRLTPIEVCRLQTIPDSYFFDQDGKQLVSDSAIYRMCGNGWTVKVISYLLSFANLPCKDSK